MWITLNPCTPGLDCSDDTPVTNNPVTATTEDENTTVLCENGPLVNQNGKDVPQFVYSTTLPFEHTINDLPSYLPVPNCDDAIVEDVSYALLTDDF